MIEMTSNFIIHQQAQKYQWSGECFLSVKSFYSGQANYQVKQREYTIDQHNFLILNECTRYRLTIDSTVNTESFCVFFAPRYVRQVLSELNASAQQLLDFSVKPGRGLQLFEKNYVHQGIVSQLLKKGRAASLMGMAPLEKDEFYHHLLYAIIRQHSSALTVSDRLGAKKKTTRIELYQRVLYAKDYIDSNYTQSLRLKELAAVALLSENHLLRSFSKIFGRTPFQYIAHKRIAEAKRLVLETNRPVHDIAMQVGYSSLSNFSTYFKHIVGLSPKALRKR